MMNSNPPIEVGQLARGCIRSLLGWIRPISKMRKHLGKQFTVDELYDPDQHSEEDITKLKLVRAYQVTSLIGASIIVQSENEISSALGQLLTTRLPGIEWPVKSDWTDPFLKYLIIHGSIPAPLDRLTLEPMALELFGELIAVDGLRLDTEKGREWMIRRQDEYIMASSKDDPTPGLAGEMVISIKSATYANVMYPGVGIPLYS